ncbi:MAG: hypothetical protein A2X36_00285 [Elusimicrobia bacterium GWA2_69_24]|nr:MAG: hypothetical protein A2X36_00285 [Elusimicrobia bacterium GWA2_69_24]
MKTLSVASWELRDGLFRHPWLERRGVPHGVTTRNLGDMKLPACRAAAARLLSPDAPAPWVSRQVHGATIHLAPSGPAQAGLEGDGWLTRTPGRPVAVFMADCLPIFMWDDALTAVGAFHSGWRGLTERMPGAAVAAFQGLGLAPDRLRAVVGPHIGACCYRVGPELRALFPAESLTEAGGGLFLDLGAEARRQLVAAGLHPDMISVSSECTSCRRDDFFSYRRDHGQDSLLALIALPPRGDAG